MAQQLNGFTKFPHSSLIFFLSFFSNQFPDSSPGYKRYGLFAHPIKLGLSLKLGESISHNQIMIHLPHLLHPLHHPPPLHHLYSPTTPTSTLYSLLLASTSHTPLPLTYQPASLSTILIHYHTQHQPQLSLPHPYHSHIINQPLILHLHLPLPSHHPPHHH